MPYIYDLEQFKNFHLGVFKNENGYKYFVIHEDRNDIKAYVAFLVECAMKNIGMVGFNNLAYDYPMLHYIMENEKRLVKLSANEINKLLYAKSQSIIEQDVSSIWNPKIPQLDLYKIYHFDNAAKRTSLKHLQVAMNWHNVQDLPLSPYATISKEQVDDIISYCYNDVDSTEEFYNLSKKAIELRKELKKDYLIDINYNDVKIGEEILLQECAKDMEMDLKDLKKMRTYRSFIEVNDIMFNYIEFKTKEFKKLHEFFKNTTISGTKSSISYSLYYDGVTYDFGQGGVHGTCGSGVWKNTEEYSLINVDVKSYYPNLAIRNEFHPEHLGMTYCRVYENIYNRRQEAKKQGNKAIDKALKLSLNGSYGKSNDKYSALYDPLYTMKTTINGQLLLAMLAEEISLAGIKIIQINTDGILVYCHNNQQEELRNISNAWMELTQLELEEDHFEMIAQRDVNNYLATFKDGSIKGKGAYEIERDWHKDQSMKVVRKAVAAYFTEGINPEDFIREHINESDDSIYDYCLSKRIGGQFKPIIRKLDTKNLTIQDIELTKTTRLYISNSGGTFIKQKDGSDQRLFVGYKVTEFNEYKPGPYDINFNFYIEEAYKLIRPLILKQTKLF